MASHAAWYPAPYGIPGGMVTRAWCPRDAASSTARALICDEHRCDAAHPFCLHPFRSPPMLCLPAEAPDMCAIYTYTMQRATCNICMCNVQHDMPGHRGRSIGSTSRRMPHCLSGLRNTSVQCFEAGWLRGALYFAFGVVMILVAFVPDQKCITVPIFGVLLIVAAVSYMLAHLRGEIYTENDNPAHGCASVGPCLL